MGEISKIERSPLLPERHPQQDFFVCDIFDAAPKADTASMEHPIFSLSTKPDTRTREYGRNGKWVKVRPSQEGLATVHDRDVLIYCISQIMAALNNGQPVSQILRFKAYDLLVATNRQTNGQAYEGLKAAMRRLQGTQIETNITTGGVEQFDLFSLIDRAKILRETREGRMLDVEIKLSDWVMNAIESKEVLTVNRRYFQLRKPLERRVYEIARKHCGRQKEWRISLSTLQEKTGSNSTAREFKRLIRKIVEDDKSHRHMPDYDFNLEKDILTVTPKSDFQCDLNRKGEGADTKNTFIPPLDPDTYELARQFAPGYDIYALEKEWRSWATEAPRSADAAFLGFCKKWYEKRGPA